VLVSNDIQGTYYVIRVLKDGEILSGKFSPELQQVFVSQEGLKDADGNVKEFEVKYLKNKI
jgi:hypothetical protein